jgi:hypothetical protein
MKRFILTGAPGAGKTAIIRQLEIDGFSVIDEAATDMIVLGRRAKSLSRGQSRRSLIQSQICNECGYCAHRTSQATSNSMIVQPSAPRPWRFVWDTLFPQCFRVNWDASGQTLFLRSPFSSSGILARS